MSQSWDEYTRAKKQQPSKIYNDNKVKSDLKKNYKRKQHEKETDALLSGHCNKKKQKNKNKKKTAISLAPETYFAEKDINNHNSPEEDIDYDSYYDFPVKSSKKQKDYSTYQYPTSYYHKYGKNHQNIRNAVYRKSAMLLTKEKRISLINGYIKQRSTKSNISF
eukprot:UN04070